MKFLMTFVTDFLGNATVLVGLVALIGLVIQKKPFTEVLTGLFKTMVGFIIFGIGAGAGVTALAHFQTLFAKAFNLTGVTPLAEGVTAMAMKDFGVITALIMVLGFIINLIFARITKFKYIFLTGQHNLFFAAMLAVVFGAAKMNPVLSVVLGAIILGIGAAVFPSLGKRGMKAITGGDEIGIGHYCTIAYGLSAWLGGLVGKPEDSTEKIKLPKSLNFFRDYVSAIAVTMIVFFYIAALVAGKPAVEEISGGINWLLFPFLQSLTFAGAVYVIITGIRMFLGEMVPAFIGISEKLIPNAIPALDCPVVFPYAPTAVIIGFLASFAGGLITMLVLILLKAPVIIPVAIPYFFIGGTAGVFGNATGGWKGAILGAFVAGVLIAVGPAIMYPIFEQIGLKGTAFPETDFNAVGIPLHYILSIFAPK
ncbi:MAG: PTS ascorbate transporter subunit IIC [Anaerolineaceae bacterium]|nr:PTS ascorbate transporter subunit IIC [Anaerolineaceae bacterium]